MADTAEKQEKTLAEKIAEKEAALKTSIKTQNNAMKRVARLRRELAKAKSQSLLEILDANKITEPNQLQDILKAIEDLDPMLIPKNKLEAEAKAKAAEKAEVESDAKPKTSEETNLA